MSSKEARERRDEARKLLGKGIDLGIERKVRKAATVDRAANSFEVVACEWFAKHAPKWAASHADKIMGRLEKDVFPWMGGGAIVDIKVPEVLAVLCHVEARGRSIQLIEFIRTVARFSDTRPRPGERSGT